MLNTGRQAVSIAALWKMPPNEIAERNANNVLLGMIEIEVIRNLWLALILHSSFYTILMNK